MKNLQMKIGVFPYHHKETLHYLLLHFPDCQFVVFHIADRFSNYLPSIIIMIVKWLARKEHQVTSPPVLFAFPWAFHVIYFDFLKKVFIFCFTFPNFYSYFNCQKCLKYQPISVKDMR